MVTEMTKYDFILMSGDADAFLKKLQEIGLVDITRSLKPVDEQSEKLSLRAGIYRKALSALKGVEPAEFAEKTYGDLAVNVLDTLKEKEEAQDQLALLRKELEESRPWGSFDREGFKKLADMGLKLHFYKAKTIDPVWAEQYALSEISSDGTYTYFVVVADSDDYDFPMKELPAPDRDCAAIEKAIADLEDEIAQKNKHLAELKCHEADLQKSLENLTSKLDLHLAQVAGEKAADEYLTVFEGFAPAASEESLRALLDQENVFYVADKAVVDDNPPIKLKNNKFVSMFELLTDMYGRPKYDEFDPTVFISIFFMLFFAFCMGDMGYGLVLIGASLALKKVLGKIAPLGITLGIATTVVGFLFHTFFSVDML